jgi:23S rRNA pseudouridine955/2504/2580 synthase
VKRVTVLYEDAQCLVVNKPAGLAVHGGAKITVCLEELLAAEFSFKPYPVHRLDKDTSGILLIAKSASNAAFFSRVFAEGRTLKQYTAICARQNSAPLAPRGRIETALEYRGVRKPACTTWIVRGSHTVNGNKWIQLELELGTGRMHQIRRHLAQLGCPLLGDDKYGDFSLNKQLRKQYKLNRMLLHATRLMVPLPGGGKLDIQAPLPAYFAFFKTAEDLS